MVLIKELKYITIEYYSYLESVALMLQEHYDKPEYKNSLFIINLIWEVANNKTEICENKKYDRIIYYNLEHKVADDYYTEWEIFDKQFLEKLLNTVNCTEFWTMDYNPQIVSSLQEMSGIPIYYKPVRYTSLIKPVNDIHTTRKTIDFCHIGSLNSTHRIDLINEFENNNCQVSFKFITQTANIEQCIPEMNISRYILDTLRIGTIVTPNQVRIFELLCMGYTVCTEKCKLNMFPGLVYEWETVDDLNAIASRGEYLHPTEAYKELTYTDEAYEKYVNYLIEQQNGI